MSMTSRVRFREDQLPNFQVLGTGAPISMRRTYQSTHQEFNKKSGDFIEEEILKHSLDTESRQVKMIRTSKRMVKTMNWQGPLDAGGYRFESHYK